MSFTFLDHTIPRLPSDTGRRSVGCGLRGLPFHRPLEPLAVEGQLAILDHVFDADEQGMFSTIAQLEEAGIERPIHVVPNGIDTETYRPATPEEREKAPKLSVNGGMATLSGREGIATAGRGPARGGPRRTGRSGLRSSIPGRCR